MEALDAMVASVAKREGFELVHVEVRGQAGTRLLRVYLDQPGGIGLEDCERASRALTAAMDLDEYTLEVSSPGLDRLLTKRSDFERFAGQRARIRTREAIAGTRIFLGTIEGADDEGVRLRREGQSAETTTLPWNALREARLAPTWEKPGKRH